MGSVAAVEALGLAVERGGRRLIGDLSFRVEPGESMAVVGSSGVGKTTLLNCVLGTVRPAAGRIQVAGVDVLGLRPPALARLRADQLGVVFQHGELLGELTPVENVALPALIAGRARAESVARATALLELFGVPTDREAADQLSGGERQRTALARALINEPAVVLADEPTGSLDVDVRDSVADVLFAAPRRWGCGLLVVTHDPQIAARADRVLTLTAASLGAP